MKVEKYVNSDGKAWVRIKYMDRYRTEVIMPEEKFKKSYGSVEGNIV